MRGRGFTLHNYDANIYFNHKCVYNNVIPISVIIQISNISPVSKFTQKRTQILRIKDEIKFYAEIGTMRSFYCVCCTAGWFTSKPYVKL